MARPRIDDIEKRVVQVNIRLTKSEAEKVYEYAKGSGMSSANWIRVKVFTGRFPTPKLSPLDAAFYQEFKKMGVNLNQIAHQLNLKEMPKAIILSVAQVRAKVDQAINLLLHDREPNKR